MKVNHNIQNDKYTISGSLVPAILGISPFITPLQAWLMLKGKFQQEENDAMKLGKNLEPFIFSYIKEKYQINCEQNKQIFFHPKYDYFSGTPDGFLFKDGQRILVEIKTTKRKVSTLPLDFYTQIQWYLWILGLQKAISTVVLLPELPAEKLLLLEPKECLKISDFLFFETAFSSDFIQKVLPIVNSFYESLELDEPPPSIISPKQVDLAYPGTDGSKVEANEQTMELVYKAMELQNKIKVLKADFESLVEQIKLFMGKAEVLSYAGETIATWKETQRVILDNRKLKEDLPDIFSKYEKVTNVRTFRLKLGGENE